MKTTGVFEWADHKVNFLTGCQHDCKYCFSKAMQCRMKRIKPEQWKNPVIRKKDLNQKFTKKDGIFMFPTSHDIHPDNLIRSLWFLGKLLKAGNNVLIVSKPHVECIDELTFQLAHFRDQILFRFTIGSVFDETLEFWEPHAPKFNERLECLNIAFERGFKTSVSIEPMLDGEPGSVITMAEDYVTDSIWLGKMNNFGNITHNGHLSLEMRGAILTIKRHQSDKKIKILYDRFKDNPMIKFKDSIKKVVGVDLNTEKGMDK